MTTVAVTCIKNGRADSFGRPLVSGTYYPNVEINTAAALWNSGYVSVADASVFDQDPLSGTSPLDDFNVARALAITRQPEQTSANIAAELAATVGVTATSSPAEQILSLVGAVVPAYNGVNAALWKHSSTSSTLVGSHWLYCPLSNGWYSVMSLMAVNSVVCPHHLGLGKIGTFVGHAGATKTGTWITATTDYIADGASTYSSVAGSQCSFTGVGSVVVLRSAGMTVGGYAIVSIDGDWTSANRLPVFTAADLGAGRCRSTDVGKRYVDTWGNTTRPDIHMVIADNLTDASHVIVFEATGTAAGGSSYRAYIGGLIFCGAAEALLAPGTAGRQVALVDLATDSIGTLGYTPELERAAGGVWDFVGGTHGNETQTSSKFYIGGTETTLSTNGWATGQVIQWRSVSSVVRSDSATVAANKTVGITACGGQAAPFVMEWSHRWTMDMRVRTGYFGMLPFAVQKQGASGFQTDRINSIGIDQVEIAKPTAKDNALHLVGARGNVAYGKTPLAVTFMVPLDGGIGCNFWASSAATFTSVRDRTDGNIKFYFERSSQTCYEQFLSGDIARGVIGYGSLPLA